jgi:hypothetical protein
MAYYLEASRRLELRKGAANANISCVYAQGLPMDMEAWSSGSI